MASGTLLRGPPLREAVGPPARAPPVPVRGPAPPPPVGPARERGPAREACPPPPFRRRRSEEPMRSLPLPLLLQDPPLAQLLLLLLFPIGPVRPADRPIECGLEPLKNEKALCSVCELFMDSELRKDRPL